MKIGKYAVLVGVVLAASFTGRASAEIVVVRSLSEFEALASAIAVDGFGDVSLTGSTASPQSRAIPPYSYAADAAPAGSFFGAGTSADPWLSSNTATDTLSFGTFQPVVSAIGGQFFVSNINGGFAAGSIVLQVVDSLGDTETLTVGAESPNSFVGFVTNGTIVSLAVTSVQPDSGFLWPTVDNLRLGVVSPSTPQIFRNGFEQAPPPAG